MKTKRSSVELRTCPSFTGGGKRPPQTLTCDGEVTEDQQAAAAEADGAAGGGQPRQEEDTEGQFTRAPRRCSLQHAFHGFSGTSTRRFSLFPEGGERFGIPGA